MTLAEFHIRVDTEDEIYPAVKELARSRVLSHTFRELFRERFERDIQVEQLASELADLRMLVEQMQGAGSSVLPRERKLVSRGLPDGARPIETIEDLDEFIEEHGLDE